MLCNGKDICAYKLIQKHLKKDKISALIASASKNFLAISRTHGQLTRPQEEDRLRYIYMVVSRPNPIGVPFTLQFPMSHQEDHRTYHDLRE